MWFLDRDRSRILPRPTRAGTRSEGVGCCAPRRGGGGGGWLEATLGLSLWIPGDPGLY
jgi:hypothetical protein